MYVGCWSGLEALVMDLYIHCGSFVLNFLFEQFRLCMFKLLGNGMLYSVVVLADCHATMPVSTSVPWV